MIVDIEVLCVMKHSIGIRESFFSSTWVSVFATSVWMHYRRHKHSRFSRLEGFTRCVHTSSCIR